MTREAEVAARIRHRLTAVLPDVKWSVRAEPSHSTSSVAIEWAGWPSFETVKTLVQAFNKRENGSIHINLCRYANAKEFEEVLLMRRQTPSREGMGES
jgi:Large polyvalent protein associated domain 29